MSTWLESRRDAVAGHRPWMRASVRKFTMQTLEFALAAQVGPSRLQIPRAS